MNQIRKDHTAMLAEFVAGLRFEDVPQAAIAHAKRIILNIAAAALWGRRTDGGRQVATVLEAMGGNPDATIIGSSVRLPAPQAAAISSAMAFATMSDDTHGPAQLHLGHALIPSALAEAESRKITGREFLTTVVAAAEAAIRIAASVGPSQDVEHNSVRMGFWSEVKNAFGPALATARLRGLDEERIRHAIGIAATSSSGMVWPSGYRPAPHTESCGTVFAWDAAKPVIMGMTAARLAEAGMTAARDSLEGARGWVRVYAMFHGDVDALTRDLGRRFEIEYIAIKMHCMSHTIFPVIEATADLILEHELSAEDIRELTIIGPAYIGENMWRTEISCFADAVCSAPFAVALAILEPDSVTLPDKVTRHLGNPDMRNLLGKFRFENDPSLPMNGGQLTGAIAVETRAGKRIYRQSKAVCRGTYPERPLAAGTIERKFHAAAEGIISSDRANEFIAQVENLESLADVAPISRLLEGANTV